MLANDQELNVTLDRIARFQRPVAHLRNVETNPANYHGSVSGFLAEIDRMQLEVRNTSAYIRPNLRKKAMHDVGVVSAFHPWAGNRIRGG